ncbi:MAG: BamA/TamA family outer membrane protein [Desulfobacterales bacterium]
MIQKTYIRSLCVELLSRKFIILLILFSLKSGQLYAEDSQISAERQDSLKTEQKEKFQEWGIFPVVAGNAETGLQLGALAIRFIKPDHPDIRTSTIDLIAFGTTNSQYYAKIAPDIYFGSGKYHANTLFSGSLWPANFYGIGNNTSKDNKEPYESTDICMELLFERKLRDIFYAGVLYQYDNSEIEPESSSLHFNNSLAGEEGGVRSGLGFSLSIDTRDNINDPRSGTFINFQTTYFEDLFGSDFTFRTVQFHTNYYHTITDETGLAFKGYVRMARGDIPFQDLSSPDGTDVLRGIECGRYRDRDLASFQAEYRYSIYEKWGGTFFIETAQVADELSDLDIDGWKYGAGAGLRYALNQREKLNVRLDISYVDSGFGIVLSNREAF